MTLATAMGVSASYADEAVAIIVTAFGSEWLQHAAQDIPVSTAMPFRRHPLGDMISTAGANQVAEALELAGYLLHVQNSEHLCALIANLKAQYHQTLLQLAFAARLKIVGAAPVALEPAASGGRFSDVLFTFDGQTYIAECYRPSVAKSGDSEHEMNRLLEGCLAIVRTHSTVFSIGISLSAGPAPRVRKEVIATVRDCVARMEIQMAEDPQSFPSTFATSPSAVISVCRGLPTAPGTPPRLQREASFPHPKDDWDVFLRQAVGRASTLSGIHGEPDSMTGLSQVALWLPPAMRAERSLTKDLDKPLEKLGRRIEAKLAQTNTPHPRLLVVDSWLTAQLHRVPAEVIARLQGKIVGAHDRVAALLMLHRQWMPSLGRFGYSMRALRSAREPTLPSELVARLAAIDHFVAA